MKIRRDLQQESSEKQLAYSVAKQEYETSLRRNYPHGTKATLSKAWFDNADQDVEVEVVGFVALAIDTESIVVSVPENAPLSAGYLCYADSPGTYGFKEGVKRRLVGVTPVHLTPLR